MAKRRAEPDWESVEREYRAGQLSVRAIAAAHKVPESTIRARARAGEWERDLSGQVRERVRAKLSRGTPDPEGGAGMGAATSDEDVIEIAATRGVKVVEQHRRDILRIRDLVDLTAVQLEKHLSDPSMEIRETRRGQVVAFVGQIFAGPGDGVASVLQAITAATQKMIALERQAFALDDPPPFDAKALTEEQLERIVAGEDPALVVAGAAPSPR